jgi:hypothetical protein
MPPLRNRFDLSAHTLIRKNQRKSQDPVDFLAMGGFFCKAQPLNALITPLPLEKNDL